MKTKYISIFVLLFALCYNSSAQVWQDMRWIDGSETLFAEKLNNSQVLLVGASYNDAGYGYLFNVKKIGAESYDLKGTNNYLNVPKAKDDIPYAIITSGNFNGEGLNWKRKEVAGMDLILKYENNQLTSIFEESSLNLKEYAQDHIMQVIEGNYTDAKGVKWNFMTDGTCIFAGKKANYTIEDRFDVPSFIIRVNRKNYFLDITADGMLIYEAVFPNSSSEDVIDNAEAIRGSLTASLSISKNTYRWSFTSAYPCSSYVLELLDKDVLRLMRNEIYARYGWRFKDAGLNDYFKAFKWYKPAASNSSIKLTEKELLNVSLLTYYENRN